MQTMAYYHGTNEYFATTLLMISSLSIAAMDVIIDSLMVVQSRKDPELGSEELQSFSWVCLGFGGIVGSLVAGMLTENYNPSYCFFTSSITALLLTVCSWCLSHQVERGDDHEIVSNNSLWTDVKLNLL